MAFIFTKISETGSSHPVNARIFIGLGEIVKLTSLEDSEKEMILGLLFKLSNDLIEAEKAALEVIGEIENIENKIARNQESSEKILEFFSVLSLNQARVFLKYSKSALRIVAQIIDIITLKQNINEAHFHKIIPKLKEKQISCNANLSLVKVLEIYAPWYEILINLRNSDDHDDHENTFLENYKIKQNLDFRYLERPQFCDKKTKQNIPVYEFLKVSLRQSLTFCENEILFSLAEYLSAILHVVEIPECDIDPKCPKRFKVIPKGMEY